MNLKVEYAQFHKCKQKLKLCYDTKDTKMRPITK